jgi:LysM repeat protein
MGLLRSLLVAAGAIGVARAQTASTPPGPTFTGSPANCNKWYVIASGDTCGSVEAKFGITHAQFISWNPAVSNDCVTNFWLGQAYCVGLGQSAPSTTTTTTSTTTRAAGSSTPPGPTFTGSPAKCNSWYLIVDGDTCGSVEAKFGITHQEFLAWNPAVSSDCTTNFWLGQAYCVGLGPAVSSTTTTSATSSSATSSSSSSTPTTTTPYSTRYPVTSQTIVRPTHSTDWPPTKTQAGQPSYCNNWHLVAPGETCDNIIAQHSTWMSTDDL